MAISATIDVDVLGRVGVALADSSRRRLLIALLDGPGYPAELADDLGFSRANVSNHLACLRGCGVVIGQQEGRRVRYQLADERLGRALRDLLDIVLTIDPDVCAAAAEDGCC
jgi:DNA-binding transcriptional ArsR family regulator